MQEFIKEEIKIIRDKILFLRNIFIAVISGLVGIVFAFSQNKVSINFLIVSLFVMGIVVIIGIIFRIHHLEEKRNELVLKLKDL